MPKPTSPPSITACLRRGASLALGLAAMLPVQAERSDRTKPMALESDQPCVVNLAKQTSACAGNVVISQGSLLLRADKLEVRETPEGWQQVQASGSADKPARVKQKRDGVDETVEGQAQRIDYDSKTGTIRFDGAAVVRRLRGAVVADEIQGTRIVWDGQAETFNVQGGGNTTPSNPGGRVRAVITPRPGTEAAAAMAAESASAPAPAPLKTTPALGERR
ncbi:lipopolysaccharide transport periplasmic protein LptA [Aquabacterium sp. OR-4]|uniref:lipopolysaccharide transport periplasmic protein LptA n=1 Tax=Aquabacterium sp. OR-4 TaxID=2978127 RepID=UPI0028C93EEE|nr:lipopolysaccharide transport periplasmic protein LptA [Aquabacterium sp. OR-4]MDT7833974.1 lipopolysaccharide transport periplasmic protein LptA [Aquabacterium sp. OR-4]